jgi:hypothetical protein
MVVGRITSGPSALFLPPGPSHADAMETPDRLFSLVDPFTRHQIALCTGPDEHGMCPSAHEGQPPCAGLRVVPQRGTPANGLPFTVSGDSSGRCPLAWVAEQMDEPPPERYGVPTEQQAGDE